MREAKLGEPIEELKAFLRGVEGEEAQVQFAGRCGTTLKYLRQVAYGAKKANETLAINLERETDGAVRVERVRPDVDWAVIRGRGPQAGEGEHAPS